VTHRIGSLCSGYEGLGAAVMEVLGGELAWVADNDPGATAILSHRFPAAKNLGDITETDWSAVEPVDILCAGFPCQDISCAGARAGLRRGTRSGLWHEIVTAITILRPRVVVIENVRALLTARGDDPTAEHLAAEASRDACGQLLEWLGNEQNLAHQKGSRERARICRARTIRVMGLRKRAVARCQWHERRLVRAVGTVLGSLADLGYDTQWVTVSASDAGAPHKRERIFILAWATANAGRGELQRRGIGGVLGVAAAGEPSEGDQRERPGDAAGDGGAATQDPDRATGGERGEPAPGQAPGWRPRADAGGPGGAPAADAESDGWDEGRPEPARLIRRPDAAERGHGIAAHSPGEQGRLRDRDHVLSGRRADEYEPAAGRGAAAHADSTGVQTRRSSTIRGQAAGRLQPVGSGGTDWGEYAPAIARWEAVTGRPAPRPTEPGRTGERLSPAFVEWMMGLPEGWVTGVPGLTRNQQLHALGNGVVPQQAAMALRLLLGAVEAGEAA